MKFDLQKRLRAWREDALLGRVVRNSGYLFTSTTFSAFLSFLQGMLATRLLGMADYGLVAGTITVFASNVNRLLSFRMSEITVRYLGETLTQQARDRAAATIRRLIVLETATSLLSFLMLVILAPWAARTLAKDSSVAPWLIFYGLFILANPVNETATGVLQAVDRFNRLARMNAVQSLITAGLIALAYWQRWGRIEVLLAYWAGKMYLSLAIAWEGWRAINATLGRGWWRVPQEQAAPWREILNFALSTNLNGTVNLFARDNVTLYLSALRSPTEVGYLRLALGLINLVMLPIGPFIWPTYAEITRTVAERQWAITRRLLRRVSLIAAAWTVPVSLGLIALGPWLVPLFYGEQARPAYGALVILLIGYGFANVFHWNRPIWLALGKPSLPLIAGALAGLLEIALTFLLVPRGGYLMQAALLSLYFLLSIGWLVWKGVHTLREAERSSP
ncbi:MAG: lipopolysaccharide biosynthesis protein [Anaerolineales bacterium]